MDMAKVRSGRVLLWIEKGETGEQSSVVPLCIVGPETFQVPDGLLLEKIPFCPEDEKEIRSLLVSGLYWGVATLEVEELGEVRVHFTNLQKINMPDPERLRLQYDDNADELTIEGTRFAGEFFRQLGDGPLGVGIGETFRVVKREDGVVTLQRLSQITADGQESATLEDGK